MLSFTSCSGKPEGLRVKLAIVSFLFLAAPIPPMEQSARSEDLTRPVHCGEGKMTAFDVAPFALP
ncbi:hypothetical protein KKG66_11455, partial [bacterium]|nr:hypothetical protein [bacterium]